MTTITNLSALLDQARTGALDRRSFMQRALAAGIGAGVAASMYRDIASATQSATAEASPGASPSASPAASPVAVDHGAMTPSITREEYLEQLQDHFTFEDPAQAGGQAIYVSTVDMKTLNPVLRSDVAALFVIGNIFNSLVTTSPIDGSNAPDLADSWEVSEDGLRYVFHLNPDATWHDGKPVTADDVTFTFDAITDPSGLCPVQADFIQVVESYRAIDAHTVEMIAKLPTAVFLNKSASLVGIMPKHIWASIPITEWGSAAGSTGTDPSQVIGSGPFTFVEWVQNDHATIAKNADYWLPDLVPTLDTYTLRVVADATSAVQSLTTGESDIADLPAAQIDAFKSGNPDMTVDIYDTFRWVFFIPNQDEKNGTFFKQKEVRQALMYALDREAIVDNLLDGYAVVANGTQPVISRAYAPDRVTTIYGYDVDKANALLDGAGWVDSDGDGIREKDGVKMSMEFPFNASDPTTTTLVPYLQQAWKAVGIDIQPSGLPQPNLIDRVFANDFQLSLLGITWTEEDQGTFFRTGVGFNLSHYSNPEYDKLNDEQLTELDDAKRMDLIIEQSNILNDDVALGIMYFSKAATASNPRLHNLRPNAYGSTWSIGYVWTDEN
ncbi:MAG: ABC transporter substrate-binding protein [Thermomicrobiales bacterium]